LLNPSGGEVGIGVTSPGNKLHVVTATQIDDVGIIRAENTTASTVNASVMAKNYYGTSQFMQWENQGVRIGSRLVTNAGAGNLVFTTGSDTERMRIDSSGNVGIGGTAGASYKVHIQGTLPTSSNASVALSTWGTSPSGTTNLYRSFESYPSTAAGSYTLSSLQHYWAGQNVIGASSTLTNQYGFFAESTLTGATNNYGFYSNIASGSNRWNFYAAGTAQNYFAGNTGVGQGTPGARLDVLADSGNIGRFINSSVVGVSISAGNNTWTSLSDESVKTDLVPIADAVPKIASLRAVTGRFTSDDVGVSRAFLIAQDVQKVFPEAVNVVDKEKNLLGLAYTDVIPLLVKAVQELTSRVAELEAK
jgi:hypothetical protein